jgi:hypothetical protein
MQALVDLVDCALRPANQHLRVAPFDHAR